LDGIDDHIELPVTLNWKDSSRYDADMASKQDFSVSFWFQFDALTSSTPQVLYSHADPADQNTLFGLLLIPQGDAAVELAWFSGDVVSGPNVGRA
jgi:hypothetical protein